MTLKDIVPLASPELLEFFLPRLAEKLYPEGRPKARSIYRGINVAEVK